MHTPYPHFAHRAGIMIGRALAASSSPPPSPPLVVTVAELASLPFVQRACASPLSPSSVLSFFFGVDYNSASYADVKGRGVPMATMQGVWYGGGDAYDKLCMSFVPAVRAVGGGTGTAVLEDPETWDGTVDGLMSQILLCDQLARNCFRGTEEAFRYDHVSEKCVKRLLDNFFHIDSEAGEASWVRREEEGGEDGSTPGRNGAIPGELYSPYVSFLVTPLMHTEDPANMELAAQVLDLSAELFKAGCDPAVAAAFEFQRVFLNDHRAVIERFGRFPHRNSKLGRTNTPEEQAWLDDVENLPGWAKSQG